MSEDADSVEAMRTAILALLRERADGAGKNDIARALDLAPHDKAVLRATLRAMEHDGVIERRGRRGAFALAGATPGVSVVEFTGRDEHGDLIGRLTSHALDDAAPTVRLVETGADRRRGGPPVGVGDRALCRLETEPGGDVVARVIKKLQKAGRRLLGVVRTGRHGARIEPIHRKDRDEYTLSPRDAHDLEDGDLVAFTVARVGRRGAKEARIEERVGRVDAPHAATLMAIAAHGVLDGFNDEELVAADAVRPAGPEGRTDLTDTPLITIDPRDARDHDDAVWAAPDEDPKNLNGHVVIVAIADVAAYVTPGSTLDRGALERGNSAYFPDRVAPMLPERLSTDLCSLREGEARPCFAVRMVFAADGAKRSHRFVRGWMRSAAKLSYEEAQAAIDGAPGAAAGPLLDTVLKPLWAAYEAVNAARTRRAPLEIDAPERRVVLDEAGRVTGVTLRERFDAHKLIEEFMIQANVCAAETLEAKRTALVYRVHDEPSREKIEALADFLPQVDLRWAKGERATPKRFNTLLARAASSDHAEVVNEMVLRSQSQAVYATENIGHFGLNLARYAHFTSPIRRYADLLVHRALIRALSLGEDGQTEAEAERLESVAQRISESERRAMAAERDATERYLSAFLSEKVGETFPARITGVTRAGLFVRLRETGADGLVPISSLGHERFIHDAVAHALIGEESGGRFILGRDVEVRLVEATPVQGGLLFDILTPAQPGPRPGRGARRRAQSRPPTNRRPHRRRR